MIICTTSKRHSQTFFQQTGLGGLPCDDHFRQNRRAHQGSHEARKIISLSGMYDENEILQIAVGASNIQSTILRMEF